MAHRRRLNVLHNVLGRSALAFFEDEKAVLPEGASTGDVKYHQGFAMEVQTLKGPIRHALAFYPSHLEIVNPVVEGWVRAQQRKRGDRDGSLVMPVLIHGDAAIAGQGVVMGTPHPVCAQEPVAAACFGIQSGGPGRGRIPARVGPLSG